MARFLSLLTVSLVALIVVIVQPAVSLAQWVEDGVPICTATGDQQLPYLVADGTGGAIITWGDGRSGSGDVYAQMIDASGTPQWSANGVAICTGTGTQQSPQLVSDGAGGAIITWMDNRSGNENIYAQRVNGSGTVQWTTNGVAICTATGDQTYPQVATDGDGGAIITWDDKRSGERDIYAQRVNATGTVQWTANGVAICTATGKQGEPQLIPDSAGGAIIAWDDVRNGNYDIYAQRVDADGNINVFWPTNGIDICTATGYQEYPQLTTDIAGGAIITWFDSRNGNFDIYAQKVHADGLVPWAIDGIPICTATGSQEYPQLALDGTGGTIITWFDSRNGNDDIYAQRIDPSGNPLWTTDGIPICTATNDQEHPQLTSDGAGGAIVTWYDARSGSYDIYAQRINASGNVRWTTDGVAICTKPGSQEHPQLTSDGTGGAIITWSYWVSGNYDVYAQRIERNGYWGYPNPTITKIVDVPQDQGGQVAITWNASRLDQYPYEIVTYYSIWRSLPSGKLAAVEIDEIGEVSPAKVGPDFSGSAYRVTTSGKDTLYWEWIGNQPAHYLPNYSYTAATLFDSTSASEGWHYFFVSTHTSDPFVFWDCQPDSGYSVDNLAPAVPKGLMAVFYADSTVLTWLSNSEPDLAYYAIYRGSCPDFMPDMPLDYTTDTTYTDLQTGYCYKISAFDFAGNESPLAGPVSVMETGAQSDLPSAFALSQNYPNPFNPITETKYTLPKDCYVRLNIFNILGQKVASLVDGEKKAGYKTVSWDAKGVASGVYLYRLQAGDFVETKRMVLLR